MLHRSSCGWWFISAATLGCAVLGCNSNRPDDIVVDPTGEVRLVPLFPSEARPGVEFDFCIYTSPISWTDDGDSWVLSMVADGQLAAQNPQTGEVAWTVDLPAPVGEGVFALAQPAWLDDHRLVIAYHTVPAGADAPYDANVLRLSHRVVVVDLRAKALDASFSPLTLEAELAANDASTLLFRADHALIRSDVVIGRQTGASLGHAYITMGNTRDIQPWHGWAFEIDLDEWATNGGANAISAVMSTTPEPDVNCGTEGTSGSRTRRCGAGLWAPSGPLLIEEAGGYHLIVGTGNGQLDLARADYANSLLRLEPGLDFDPACDPLLCADFDPDAPSLACVESCENLFIPRLMSDQEIQLPADGRCDGDLTLFECWQEMDYIGGSTPVQLKAFGKSLLVYPTKDGHAYLIDADHLGTMYDRHRLVELCGTTEDPCSKTWAGMAVTQPLVIGEGQDAMILIATFMPDHTHPAGVVALKVVDTANGPRLERQWEHPSFASAAAVAQFREHPSRIVAAPLVAGGEPMAWVVDVGKAGDKGRLIVLDPENGQVVFDKTLTGPGQRYTLPLVTGDAVYLSSCKGDKAPGRLEAFSLVKSN